jgi:hypothetical protein
MINKNNFFSQIFKIDKKKSGPFSIKKILKSIFFLKYIIIIFTSLFVIYLTVPKVFNYEKKLVHLKKNLLKNYSIEIKEYSAIYYNILPTPHLVFTNSKLIIDKELINGDVKNFKVILNLGQIYNYQNIDIKKIILKNAEINIELNNIKNLIKYIARLDKKIYFKETKIQLTNKNQKIVSLNDIKFDNNNQNNLLLNGRFLKKKFKLRFIKKKDNKKITFNFPIIGLNSETNFLDSKSLDNFMAKTRIQILDNKFKFDLKKNKNLTIYNSNFRNTVIQTTYDGILKFNPYFSFDFALKLKYLNLKKLLNKIKKTKNNFFSLSEKLNGNLRINLKKNSLTSQFIQEADIPLILKNRNIKVDNSYLKFKGGNMIVNGHYIDNQDYKKFKYDVELNINQTRKTLKKLNLNISDNIKDKNAIKITGLLNLSKKKIRIDKLVVNKKTIKDKEVIENYKQKFENILIKNSILDIVDFYKLKNFIKEIY